jgi:hypothetical protein
LSQTVAKVIALAVACVGICLAQTPPEATGRIEGRVTSTTGVPLGHVSIQLQEYRAGGPNLPHPRLYTSASDASGNFVIDAVIPAIYFVSTNNLSGFQIENPLLTVTVRAGQPASLSIRMIQLAQISGRLTDADGAPPGNAGVSLWQWTVQPGGFKQLTSQSGYKERVAKDGTFTITDLGPGLYYARAEDYAAGTGTALPATWPREKSQAAFYPGTADISSAVLLNAHAGAVIRDLDIRLPRATVYRIRGIAVEGDTGWAAIGMTITLSPEGASNEEVPPAYRRTLDTSVSARTREDGTFEFDDVLPGEYVVSAHPNPAKGVQDYVLFGDQRITVGHENVENLTERLVPGTGLEVNFRTEGSYSIRPVFEQLISVGTYGFATYKVSYENSPGTRIMFGNLPPGKYAPLFRFAGGAYVQSIRLGDKDVGEFIDLPAQASEALQVVFSTHTAEVTGMVRNSSGDSLPKVWVRVWKPGQQAGWGFVGEGARTGLDGTFRIAGLPPGEYRVAAWEGSWPASELLSQLDNQGAAIKLSEDSHLTVDPPLVTQAAIDAALANVPKYPR